jgi:hypothetical protein
MEKDRQSFLNEHQKRRLRVTCQHIDRLLSDIENILHASESRSSFRRYAADIPPELKRSMEGYIKDIRAQLIAALLTAGLETQAEPISAGRAIQTTLLYIEVAAEELAPRYMRGYGPVGLQAAEMLEEISGNLSKLVRQIQLAWEQKR